MAKLLTDEQAKEFTEGLRELVANAIEGMNASWAELARTVTDVAEYGVQDRKPQPELVFTRGELVEVSDRLEILYDTNHTTDLAEEIREKIDAFLYPDSTDD